MNNAMSILLAVSEAANPFETMTNPIIDLLDMILGPALAIVGALGAIFCIILGVKFAKAEEPQDREKAKHGLKNAIIGFVLLVGLKIGLPAMQQWATSTTTSSTTSNSSR